MITAQPLTRSQVLAAARWGQKVEATGNLIASKYALSMGIPAEEIRGARLNKERGTVDFEIVNNGAQRTAFMPMDWLSSPPFEVEYPTPDADDEGDEDEGDDNAL